MRMKKRRKEERTKKMLDAACMKYEKFEQKAANRLCVRK